MLNIYFFHHLLKCLSSFPLKHSGNFCLLEGCLATPGVVFWPRDGAGGDPSPLLQCGQICRDVRLVVRIRVLVMTAPQFVLFECAQVNMRGDVGSKITHNPKSVRTVGHRVICVLCFSPATKASTSVSFRAWLTCFSSSRHQEAALPASRTALVSGDLRNP